MEIGEEFSRAIYEFFFLLSNNYPRKASLDIVKSRYSIPRRAALLLYRCIHSKRDSVEILRKLIDSSKVINREIIIDGFNQLTTIYAILHGYSVFKCSDGVIRDDLLAGPRFVINNIDRLSVLLSTALDKLYPKRAVIVLDSQPSHSGYAASILRKRVESLSIQIEVMVSKNADKTIIEFTEKGYIVASSDIVILKKAKEVFDLANYVITEIIRAENKITNIPLLLKKLHGEWCRQGPVA